MKHTIRLCLMLVAAGAAPAALHAQDKRYGPGAG
jgi:hypothetical protein